MSDFQKMVDAAVQRKLLALAEEAADLIVRKIQMRETNGVELTPQMRNLVESAKHAGHKRRVVNMVPGNVMVQASANATSIVSKYRGKRREEAETILFILKENGGRMKKAKLMIEAANFMNTARSNTSRCGTYLMRDRALLIVE